MAATSSTFALHSTVASAGRRPRDRVSAYQPLPSGGLGWLRFVFFVFVARPILFFLMGLDVHHRERLPPKGPAVLVANHNSHFDTMALLLVLPLATLRRARPVAAADYFDKPTLFGWFVRHIIGVVFVPRTGARGDVLAPIVEALRAGDVVIFFPEGTRGQPGEMAPFKSGLGKLLERCPDVPAIPIHLRGVERVLPRGAIVPLPLVCDVTIGEAMWKTGDARSFVESVRDRLDRLARTRHVARTSAEVAQ